MLGVFVDQDGVLTDFVRGALAHHKSNLPYEDVGWDFFKQIGFEGREDLFWKEFGREFWARLRPHADGTQLLDKIVAHAGIDKVGLLTSPCDTDGCLEGKRDWVREHLPAFKRRVFLGSAKELFAGPTKVLVDDSDANVDKFRKAGGLAVLVPRPWNQRKLDCLPGGAFNPGRLLEEVKHAIEIAVLTANPGRDDI